MNESTGRILVIEDNQTNLDLMIYLLEAFGYTLLTTMDGEAGLELARREMPDLIICDVHLPKLDGYGVVQQLKADVELCRIPVVAVTALAMVGDRDRMLAAGFDGYISKPIEPEVFVERIGRLLPETLRSRRRVERDAVLAESAEGARMTGDVRARLLVVDDTPANIEFARSTFEPSGYTVLSASNVRDALVLANAHVIDLVLCDLHMLPESGRDLLELARQIPHFAGIPLVIISSTSTEEGERVDCLKSGATRFIRRPIEPHALLAEVAALLPGSKEP